MLINKLKKSIMIIFSWLINNSSPYAYHFPVLQSVTITTNVVSSNPTHGKVYITLYDTVCQWLVAGLWFSPVFSTNKTDRHYIAEILLKVALKTTTLTLTLLLSKHWKGKDYFKNINEHGYTTIGSDLNSKTLFRILKYIIYHLHTHRTPYV